MEKKKDKIAIKKKNSPSGKGMWDGRSEHHVVLLPAGAECIQCPEGQGEEGETRLFRTQVSKAIRI